MRMRDWGVMMMLVLAAALGSLLADAVLWMWRSAALVRVVGGAG